MYVIQDCYEFTKEELDVFRTSKECLCERKYPTGFECRFCSATHGSKCMFAYKCLNDRYDCGVAVWCCRDCNGKMTLENQICPNCLKNCCGATCPTDPEHIDIYKIHLKDHEKHLDIVYCEDVPLVIEVPCLIASIHHSGRKYYITMTFKKETADLIWLLFMQIGAILQHQTNEVSKVIAHHVHTLRGRSQLTCPLEFADENQTTPNEWNPSDFAARIHFNCVYKKECKWFHYPINFVATIIE